ncbi:3-(cis-5,6-dihydroxycyclohexa-1,3-dien-1-yl)propanoate dehydrogenase [Mycobacterium nebraskense]|uniref:2,3-dihydroxy-2,3-dihydrophenylpropionate dehydrogenase n=1 Tax=Mycobacterium nebraskense TaxID=244292 RepID=A0A0F5NDF7_9MYCO|nr:3-(cis-5,6-dihydroxycyclohexa-1,3-dien-1-yl)propanoate dehydrogenase [Mycobacterium nebraskense]KKC04298.1 2,3-dihydroxy-2,3-dihydrophenylpropionate dehydrogenase [Mycobacterium nebraskense]KLO38289.1 2,3-dihydroxy-2,3-dihydrophenylpropionate dehydrogenase [Mycobacterium nebraskense]MBI2695218.1 3-(cis-5,6-dihydroxycyclohexa-1,3-dien-1-yl)propanoate dehydrogenase [Mycobacterium nebraskense]MCV7118852.1 3-(cis-5,6-dihydroxycyclohexa-1,3-dien-1-yl)propanoate dehydrogenase [Mycobacterium nebras
MTGWLEGKRALVVGAGSGIGRAVVDSFRAEGAKVAALERDREKCERLRVELPGVPVVEGDAITRDANERAVDAAVDAHGGLDTLVNCVGIFDFYKGIGDIDAGDLPDAFDEMFRTNVLSHLQSVKAALPRLRAGTGSSIILTESASSFYPGRGGALYVSSKFAVRGLVAALAHELAPQIRVNGVAPGGTLNTDLRGLASLGLDGVRLDDTPNRAQEVAERTPLNVALSGEDHAWSFVFLASDHARGITGETVRPDGGFGLGAPQ